MTQVYDMYAQDGIPTISSPEDLIHAARLYIDAVMLRYLWSNLWRSHDYYIIKAKMTYKSWNTIHAVLRFYEEDCQINLQYHVQLNYGLTVPLAYDVEQELKKEKS